VSLFGDKVVLRVETSYKWNISQVKKVKGTKAWEKRKSWTDKNLLSKKIKIREN